MAKRCREAADVCYGVGLLNENQQNWLEFGQHFFLADYYHKAISEARKYVSNSTPLVAFSWPIYLPLWIIFGLSNDVIFDTHIYTPGASYLWQILDYYDLNLLMIRLYEWCTGRQVLLGEFALSNFQASHQDTRQWQLYADSIFAKMKKYVGAGALLWNFDCQYDSWSMSAISDKIGVRWHLNQL